jgi:peptide-methionine (S)-S-oxide reductase
VDSRFGSLPGVVRTRVGYTGGTSPDPTYYNLGDHTETVQVDYDPAQITYAELLEVFWQGHNPRSRPYSRQYMAAVFYHNQEQKELALAWRDRVAAQLGEPIYTEVLPAGEFYLAEDYHQKYNLQRYQAYYGELSAIYPDMEGLVNSTAAARLNGYLAGYGTREQLEAEIGQLGLSLDLRERLAGRFGVTLPPEGEQCAVPLD